MRAALVDDGGVVREPQHHRVEQAGEAAARDQADRHPGQPDRRLRRQEAASGAGGDEVRLVADPGHRVDREAGDKWGSGTARS